jgi:hypothetical protein
MTSYECWVHLIIFGLIGIHIVVFEKWSKIKHNLTGYLLTAKKNSRDIIRQLIETK